MFEFIGLPETVQCVVRYFSCLISGGGGAGPNYGTCRTAADGRCCRRKRRSAHVDTTLDSALLRCTEDRVNGVTVCRAENEWEPATLSGSGPRVILPQRLGDFQGKCRRHITYSDSGVT